MGGKDHNTGQPRKELKFIVQEGDVQYRWNISMLNKEGQPNYLIERLLDLSVGDERVLEMIRQGGRNYIDVRKVDEAARPEHEADDGDEA